MKLELLDNENSTVWESLKALREIISLVEKRYDTKVYIDSECEIGKHWTDTKVYLHGERRFVDLVCMKLITWQHRYLKLCDHYLFAYPIEEK